MAENERWMRVTRPNHVEWLRVQQEVEALMSGGRKLLVWRSLGVPLDGVAIFGSRSALAGGSFWFSPAIVPLIRDLLGRLGAETCDAPVGEDLTLVSATDVDAAWGLVGGPRRGA